MGKDDLHLSAYWKRKSKRSQPDRPRRPDGSAPVAHQYIRVSSDRQADEGMSLEAQATNTRAAADRLAAERGFLVGHSYADPGVSASKVMFMERPGVIALMGAARSGDLIIVQRIDRAFRDPGDQFMALADLAARGIMFFEVAGHRLIDVNDPNMECMVGMLGVFNRMSNRIQTARVCEAKGAALDRGEYPYSPSPLGYRIVKRKLAGGRIKKTIEENPEEAKLLDMLVALADSHGTSKASRMCKETGIVYRGKVIDNLNSFDDLVRAWRERRAGKYPQAVARCLAAMAAKKAAQKQPAETA